MSVIDLAQARKDRHPHIGGPAKCLQCGHEWAATALVGETWLECPACHLQKGAFTGPCYPHDALIWECACGNELFLISPDGELCPVCGEYADDA